MNPTDQPADTIKAEITVYQAKLDAYTRKHLPPALWASFDPSDVVQDVYFEALRRSTQFFQIDPDDRLRWLLTITRNRITYLMRRHLLARRSDQPQQKMEQESLVALLEELAVYERTPSASAASHEAHSAVRQSINRLPPVLAGAIQCRYFDGLTPKAMADKLGKKENAVHQLCHRALVALRGELAE